MARREWALKKALKVWASFRGGLGDYGAQLAYGEHARAVRVVKAEIKRVHLDGRNYGIVDQVIIVTALERVLAALTKGRA